MKGALLFFAILSTLFLSCYSFTNISLEEKIQVTNEIKALLDEYPESFNHHDLKWFQRFWAKSNGFALAGDGKLETNYDSAITMRYNEAFSKFKAVSHFQLSNGVAYVLDRNSASYATEYDWGLVTTEGDTLKARGSWLYVFKRDGTEWKVVQSGGTHTYYK